MNYRAGVVTGVVATVALIGSSYGAWWLYRQGPITPSKAPPLPAPASVSKTVKEDQFNVVTLSLEAQAKLAIETGKVERRSIARRRIYGGEVAIPPGQVILVTAPLGGELQIPEVGLPRAGASVKKGQVIFRLLPLLTPEGRVTIATAKVDADGQVNNAKVQVEAARVVHERAKRMMRDETGSRRQMEDAQAALDVATKTLDAAVNRRELLTKAAGSIDKGTASPLPIEAPRTGLLRNLSAQAGQTVPPGAALFEVVELDDVWVRVPVFVGDVPGLDGRGDAEVGNLTGWNKGGRLAKPVAAPPSANSASGTVDLYYALDNRAAHLSPGERIGVSLPLAGRAETLTVPWPAVLYDVHGGNWVYEKTGERSYVRRRVVLEYVVGGVAVLDRGPPVGTVVVTAGAEELFGTEVGFGK